MSLTFYRDLTCDGCQIGWTLSEGEDPRKYMRRDGWVRIGKKHFCRDCQVKGKAGEQLELAAVEGA